ncbi:protein FAM207A [Erpetoichthys calabaricus]|uniref:Family with sequence similarity 207 member A n=1 Tax=Erpetoichthys calabaricus TaxID=27687 RepID=A0A8C4TEU0_ERPCA|nr:protein FAM207A [Erpetoichthys calabaricus]
MVGKIKRTRQKLHQEAVKVQLPHAEILNVKGESPQIVQKPLVDVSRTNETGHQRFQKRDVLSSSIFAHTKIDPAALVKTLNYTNDSNSPSIPTGASPELDQMSIKQNYEAEERKQMKKKEKMKQRRDKWLNKINNIKLANQKQKEEAKRKKTPVVGDMQPLADALPELSQLITSSRQRSLQKIRKINVKKKPDPTDFSQMKPAQKRKFLDSEVSRFAEALSNSVVKSSRLAAIGDHLRKRLKKEEEEAVF